MNLNSMISMERVKMPEPCTSKYFLPIPYESFNYNISSLLYIHALLCPLMLNNKHLIKIKSKDMDHKSARVSARTPSSGDEFKDVIKGLIKLLMLVIFLGYAFIWILMPTLIYRTKWLPVMRTEFGFSTYFGLAGPYYRIYDTHLFVCLFVCFSL